MMLKPEKQSSVKKYDMAAKPGVKAPAALPKAPAAPLPAGPMPAPELAPEAMPKLPAPAPALKAPGAPKIKSTEALRAIFKKKFGTKPGMDPFGA